LSFCSEVVAPTTATNSSLSVAQISKRSRLIDQDILARKNVLQENKSVSFGYTQNRRANKTGKLGEADRRARLSGKVRQAGRQGRKAVKAGRPTRQAGQQSRQANKASRSTRQAGSQGRKAVKAGRPTWQPGQKAGSPTRQAG
jgi:hypothetical protein